MCEWFQGLFNTLLSNSWSLGDLRLFLKIRNNNNNNNKKKKTKQLIILRVYTGVIALLICVITTDSAAIVIIILTIYLTLLFLTGSNEWVLCEHPWLSWRVGLKQAILSLNPGYRNLQLCCTS